VINYRAELEQLKASGHAVNAIFPLRPFSYRETEPSESVEPPSAKHWLGTDTEGRDVFARMLYGTRISLTIGVVAVALYVGIGIVLGALAGYFGGWVDSVISRSIEIVICFPSFFLILTLAALIEQRSIFHVMVIIGVTNWTGVARLIRAEFLQQKNLEYTQAAIALGLPESRVIFRHLLPNAIAPVLVSATFGIASAILIESSLSFLGIGDATAASWGQTLNAGRLEQKLWLVLAPGLAIFFVVSVFNLVGEGLRDALDPKLRS
jgi:peptide/nickel transport system permease protein